MSSRFGDSIAGKRRRRTATIAAVSSTESVVCVRYARGCDSGGATRSASSTDSTRKTDSGASPVVPSTSSWPACATSTSGRTPRARIHPLPTAPPDASPRAGERLLAVVDDGRAGQEIGQPAPPLVEEHRHESEERGGDRDREADQSQERPSERRRL